MSKFSPWWKPSKSNLERRVERINQYRDTTTSTDEQLRMAGFALLALLLFTGSLAAMNYFLFFSHTLPFWFSVGAALLLTAAIEYGKAKMGLMALQKVFLEGWQEIFSTPAQTIMWAGTLVFALATFVMSVLNSTKGGEAMAAKLGREKHQERFVPDTKYFDDQIAAATAIQQEHSANKYQKNIVYQSTIVAKKQSSLISKLNEDRQKSVNQQRADWEKRTGQQEAETSTAAGMVLKAGGWIEGLQLVLIFIIAASQKALEEKMNTPSPTPNEGTRRTVPPHNQQPINEFRGNLNSSAAQNMASFPVPHAQRSVTSDTAVSHDNRELGDSNADSVLKAARTELLRDLANLRNSNGAPESIAKRMHSVFNRVGRAAWRSGFDPSAKAANDYCTTATDAVAAVAEAGYPYEYASEHLEQIHVTIAAAA